MPTSAASRVQCLHRRGALAARTCARGRRSWGLIFDPAIADEFSGRISLLNDPRETIGAALKYLDYSLNTTSDDELNEAMELVASSRDRLAVWVPETVSWLVRQHCGTR